MKKTIVVLLLAMVSGWVSAQRHTYMHEDFLDVNPYIHEELWDLTDQSGMASLYFISSKEAGGEAPEALWGYYPEIGLSRQMEGTYTLISRSFTTKADVRNYVTLKYYYEADKNSAADVRTLGLAVRKDGGEWEVCKEINTFPMNLGQGMLVGLLPDDMNNTTGVQIGVFHKTAKDNTKYLLYIDDIEFFAFPDNYYAFSYGWDGNPYTDNGDLRVNLLLENAGNGMTSCELSYSFAEGDVQTETLEFKNGLLPGENYKISGFEPEGWDRSDYGRHKVEFWLSKVDGEAVAAENIVKTAKYLTNIDPTVADAYAFRPLVEQFTSSTCGPCAIYNQTLNPLYASLDDTMTLVKYQMNWPGNGDPYYTEEGGARRMYYGINSVPAGKLNGRDLNLTNATSVRSNILSSAGKKVYFGMWFDTVAIDASQHVHVVLKVKAVGGMEDIRLHTAVMERTTEGNVSSNGETEFHNVMLKMLPDAEGVKVDLVADSVYTFSYTYDMTKTHMEEFNDLRVACFLQTASGDVLQSVWGNVGSWSAEPGAMLYVDYMPTYICAADVPAGLKVVGTGGSPVTSVEVTARIGAAGTPVVQDFAMNLNWGESTFKAFDGLKVAADAQGNDTVYFQVTKVNGEPFEGQEIRRAIVVQPSQYAFSPLLEGFTSAGVTGSVALNQYLDALDEAGDVTVVKFPMKGDKYTRTAYTRYAAKIGVSAAPGLGMNGYCVGLADDGKLLDEEYFADILEQTKKNNSIISIKAEGEVTIGAGGTTNVMAQLNFESAVNGSYRLYMIVVESETKLNVGTNGEKQFKRVVQALFPDENGNGIAVRDGKGLYVLSRSILSSKVEDYNNLSLVVIVKDAAGNEVLQTAEFPILNNVANEGKLAYGTLEVYPNPASEYVYLKALENAALDVFDMNGVKVFGLKGISGDYTLDVQGYTPGVYVVRVQEADKVATARINVVR